MNYDTIPEKWLNINPDERTYSALRRLLPAVSENQLPKLRTVLTGIYDDGVFCSGKAADGTLTVYRHGFYLYAEQEAATVYSVSLAGSLMNQDYTSLTADLALDAEKLMDLPWFWPLTIAGKIRLEENRGKNSDKAEKRYLDELRNQRIYPVTPDFVSEAVEIADAEEYDRNLRDGLKIALHGLTEREQQVALLYVAQNQKREHVARDLHIQPATVSNTKSRGIGKLRAYFFPQEST